MHLYKNRDFPHQVMPLNSSFEELEEEWSALRKDKTRSLNKLFFICGPWLDEWQEELTTLKPLPGAQMQFLMMGLESVGDPRQLINSWLSTLQGSGTSVKSELEYLLIELVRSKYWISKTGFASPRCCAQVAAVLFRYKLRNQIQNTWKKVDYVPVVDIEEYTEPWCDSEIDHLLINALGLSSWKSYIFEMYKQGYSRDEVIAYTHYPQHIIRRELTELWNQLNTT